jgi:lipopolysaccharide export system permease protein
MKRVVPISLLDWLVLKDLIPFFFAGIALFSGLWFAADPLLAASRYLSGGAPLWLVVRVVGAYIPLIFAFTLPMAMLLAVLQGFGRLSGDSEAVALYAGGIPFARIVAPAIAMGLVASLLGYGIADHIASSAANQKAQIETQIKHYTPVASSELIHEPLYLESENNGILQNFVQVEGGVDTHTGTMRDVTVVLYDQKGIPSMLVHALSAQYEGVTPDDLKHWKLNGAMGAYLDPSQQAAYYLSGNTLTSFKSNALMSQALQRSLNATPQQMALMGRDPQTLDFAQARQRIADMIASDHPIGDIRGAETDLWSRVALPFSALVFTVIGAPLGLRSQRSSKMTGWFLAILIIFGYYVLTTTMSFAARGGVVSPVLAAFLPHLIGLAIGAFLVWRASK